MSRTRLRMPAPEHALDETYARRRCDGNITNDVSKIVHPINVS